MTDLDPVPFRPYARLLTMLGDQLIKNERVALVEIAKNAYDADASWVKITFDGFDPDYSCTPASRILIEDDGLGMTADVVKNHWANPVTPLKLQAKRVKPRTKKDRVVQGEKGIGRFALLKLGRHLRIVSRAINSAAELVWELDLSGYDPDFLDEDKGALFLDDLHFTLESVEPPRQIREEGLSLGATRSLRAPHGTRIEISHLASDWSPEKVHGVFADLARLQSIFDRPPGALDPDPFQVFIYRNEEYQPFADQRRDDLGTLLETRAVLHVEGRFLPQTSSFSFSINGACQALRLDDPALTGMRIFRDALPDFLPSKPGDSEAQKPKPSLECGPFSYEFYVFDFDATAPARFKLDRGDKQLVRSHRIYLYRDGIRVYPYGDPDDDWLLIDTRRGTVKASEFLSNDQVVGHISITQSGNPKLRDKTSREGLVDTGLATSQFRGLLQVLLAWIRAKPYARYKLSQRKRGGVDAFRRGLVRSALEAAFQAAEEPGTPEIVREQLREAANLYRKEHRYLVQRAEETEHLAGVGLSVESTTHDLHLALRSSTSVLDALLSDVSSDRELDRGTLETQLLAIRGGLAFLSDQLKGIQTLFKSSKQRRKVIRVVEIVRRVEHLFSPLVRKVGASVAIEELGQPLVARTTDAVLLQVLLNLFDNALYWLEGRPDPRLIKILLDGNRQAMTFGDNGPGIADDDLPYVFEPFYSGKGEDGRGLGLYIARQLLERQEYAIDLADRRDRLLPGANFTVTFLPEDP